MTIREGYSLTKSELKAIPPTQRTARSAYRVYPDNKWFGFVPTSTNPEDADTIVPNTGSGRWEAMNAASVDGGGSGGGSGDLSALQSQVDALNIDVYTPDFGLVDRVTLLESSSSSDLADRVSTIEFQLNGSEQDGFIGQTENSIAFINSRLNAIQDTLDEILSRLP